uniref:NADH-ubiquinone oxidoreductase chain 6 n=1 Tax=Opisthopterus tardoore TaxID=1267197 RepID=A0A347YEC3_9TELE|nr:NADH dehydrogenase subunit 6 [Opisthopterus tardoore]BAX73580.1 NADH dehydrogenase subunit 6 [Opisthopterus tardoore]BBF17036.1 NADH dehydrogenase subunit 6 [Opisthopterus tardoore]
MSYFALMWMLGMVVAMVGVASNPAPYFGAFGLVFASGAACGVLAVYGMPFLALVLFLIYLGGMMVVFVYSSGLAADLFPEDWSEVAVFMSVVLYGVGLIYVGTCVIPVCYEYGEFLGVCKEFFVVRDDTGVVMIYSVGGAVIVVCAWALLLALIVVLELVRGRNRGALRAV